MKKRPTALFLLSVKLSLFLSAFFLFASCSKPIIGDMLEIGAFSDKNDLVNLYKQHNFPLVIIGNHIYVPPSVCIIERNFGGDIAKRNIAGNAESRTVGGAAETRAMTGGAEARSLTGDTEVRKITGGVEAREITGDTETRNITGGSETRKLKGDIAVREEATVIERREVAGEIQARDIAGDIETRNIAGDSDARKFDGSSVGIMCYSRYKKLGFRLLNVSNYAKVRVFDGYEIREVDNMVIEY